MGFVQTQLALMGWLEVLIIGKSNDVTFNLIQLVFLFTAGRREGVCVLSKVKRDQKFPHL